MSRIPPEAMAIPAIVERLRCLHTALVCDVLDSLNHRRSHLGYEVAPLTPGMQVAGTAFTLQTEPVDEVPDPPYRQLLASYGLMRPGDVIVVASDANVSSGIWGELLSVAARARGAVGAVTDGLTRDVEQIHALKFPVFARGASPLDSAGRQEVTGVNVPVSIGEAVISPGDLVVGDEMGVVSVPRALAPQVVTLAERKKDGESLVRSALEAGEEISEVFSLYGML